MNDPSHGYLLRIYAALLHLYPSNFRRQFGPDMLDAFSQLIDHHGPLLASILILREFVPTLLREHFDDPASLARLIRQILCPLPALILYAAALARVQHLEEFALLTFWLICILTAFWNTGCRGRLCLLRTSAASVIGMLLPLALINTYQPMFPGFLSLAAPLALFAATVGLILAAFARLTMEGLALNWTRRVAL
jgi:hypothetical protein